MLNRIDMVMELMERFYNKVSWIFSRTNIIPEVAKSFYNKISWMFSRSHSSGDDGLYSTTRYTGY